MNSLARAFLVALLGLGVVGCFTSSDDEMQLVVNLKTGEKHRIGREDPLPPDHARCEGDGRDPAQDGCPPPYECTRLDHETCRLRIDCSPADGASECLPRGHGGGECTAEECPPAVGAALIRCEDGSFVGAVCQRQADGVCRNEFQECPGHGECRPDECPAVGLAAPAMICPDGSIAGPVCRRNADGMCGLEWRECPYPGECTTAQCNEGPIPDQAICLDGSAPPPLECKRNEEGLCRWHTQPCPTTCTEAQCNMGPIPSVVPCADGSTPPIACRSTREGCRWQVGECVAACSREECGERPLFERMCPDGSSSYADRCERNPDGVCGWHIRECPATCEATSCSGPRPGAPSYLCPDGSTAGPICAPISGGCGWTIRECPTPPPSCTVEDCGPRVSDPAICSDGSSSETVCRVNADGRCGWQSVCPGT